MRAHEGAQGKCVIISVIEVRPHFTPTGPSVLTTLLVALILMDASTGVSLHAFPRAWVGFRGDRHSHHDG